MIKYKPKQITITSYEGYLPSTKNVVLIVEYNSIHNVWLPSSLSEILYFKYSQYSVNTNLGMARTICNFLNYINEQIYIAESPEFSILKKKGLYGVNLIHAAKYLTYLNHYKCNNYKTIKEKEDNLLDFYDYLIKKKLLDKSVYLEHTIVERTINGRKVKVPSIVSPFNDPPYNVIYPDRGKKSTKPKLQNLSQAEWELLLEVAESVCGEIALGVAFQIMGGLRCGEVVNLLISSITLEPSHNRLIADISDNQSILFYNRNVDGDKCQVKQPRYNQLIFNFNGDIFRLWDKHLLMLNNLHKRNNKKALFIDDFGNPMTGAVYQKKFRELKEAFLDKLSEKKHSKAKDYKENYKWGTHIGRHIFTNHLISKGLCNDASGKPSARILANLRGDSNESSARVYIDNITLANIINENIQRVSEMADNE